MRTIQSSEAKIHLAALLDAVERGETFVITRHGKAIAQLIRATGDARDAQTVVAQLQALRAQAQGGLLQDILSDRRAGHRA